MSKRRASERVENRTERGNERDSERERERRNERKNETGSKQRIGTGSKPKKNKLADASFVFFSSASRCVIFVFAFFFAYLLYFASYKTN